MQLSAFDTEMASDHDTYETCISVQLLENFCRQMYVMAGKPFLRTHFGDYTAEAGATGPQYAASRRGRLKLRHYDIIVAT